MAAAQVIVDIIVNVQKFLFYSWWLIIAVILVIAKKKMGKYPIDAVIIEKRGDNLIKLNDRCGRFEDRDMGMHFYRLKKSGDTIPIYNYDWIVHSIAVPTNFMDKVINMLQGNAGTIFLFRYGSKQYKPINLGLKGETKKKLKEIKDENGNSVFIQVYQQFDPRDKLGALDFEVVDWDNINFMVQEQRASIIRRQKKGEFLKQVLVPMAIIAASIIISIFILKFSYDASRNIAGTTPSVSGEGQGSKIFNAIQGGMTPAE